MQCNIDQRGRLVRLAAGALLDGLGMVLVVLAAIGTLQGSWPWVAGIAAMVGGAILIFEGLRGWCVLRAMGLRTPC
jgi:Co/Zn/Cd efflux system component